MFPPDDLEPYWVNRYVGVVVAELAATLILYTILRIIHYFVWGHYASIINQNMEAKQQADIDQRRWDQAGWDVCFPIIFANHIIALAMPMLYMPSVLVCVLAFVHFGGFLALLIVNIFIRDVTGTRTEVSRIIWAIMCLINMALFIIGLVRMSYVIARI